MNLVQVREPRMRAVPAKANRAGFAVAVFGHNALGLVFVGLLAFAIQLVVLGCAVQKEHDVGILLD